jgi:hypothetical protein
MTLTRRIFMVGATYVSARAALSNSMLHSVGGSRGAAVGTLSDWNEDAATPATAYRAYRSKGGHKL